MLTPLLILSGIGLVMSAMLAIGRKVFAVDVDERQEKINDILPGANCGGCGYPGCSGFAVALVEKKSSPTACPLCSSDTMEQIGQILGIKIEKVEPMVALIRCAGDNTSAPARSQYLGIANCTAANAVSSGGKACTYGCLGLGSCADVCTFDAIVTTDNGLCYVDSNLCTGCKKCVEACPRGLIKMVPKSAKVHVLCANPNKAKEVKAVCSVGCTGCKLCTKQSKNFAMSGPLASVDYSNKTDIPESAALACGPGAILDTSIYTTASWITDSNTRTDYEKRSADWKAAEKERKAAARKKATDAAKGGE